jgi:CheY-like chemotaxis protein
MIPSDARILVVDDDRTIRKLTQTVLARSGAEVLTACDGEEALALLVAEADVGAPLPDVVVADLHMPGMDGLELLLQVRSHPDLAELPFVLHTSEDKPELRAAASALGADGYAVKGYAARQLAETVAEICAEIRLHPLPRAA